MRRASPIARRSAGDPRIDRALDPVRDSVNRLVDEAREVRSLIPTIETPWSLNTKPSQPHLYDDEFDQATLSQKWTYQLGGISTTAIDPYAGFTTADTCRRSLNSYRPDWLMFQSPADDTDYGLFQEIKLPTNIVFHARCSWQHRGAGIVANDSTIGLYLAADDGAGAPDLDNLLTVCLIESETNVVQIQWERRNGGVVTTLHLGTDSEGLGSAFEHIAIHKVGTNYHAWVGTRSGSWTYCQQSSVAPATLVWVGVLCRNSSNLGPGNKITGVDFFRARNTAIWPP